MCSRWCRGRTRCCGTLCAVWSSGTRSTSSVLNEACGKASRRATQLCVAWIDSRKPHLVLTGVVLPGLPVHCPLYIHTETQWPAADLLLIRIAPKPYSHPILCSRLFLSDTIGDVMHLRPMRTLHCTTLSHEVSINKHFDVHQSKSNAQATFKARVRAQMQSEEVSRCWQAAGIRRS